MSRCKLALAAFVASIIAAPATPQTPSRSCGDTATVQRGDTLSGIAERCDVTERSLIRLNPGIEGSRDLRVGMQIRTREGSGSGSDAVDRLGSLAGEAAGALAGFARDVGSSAQELLEKNPDLRQRLEGLGQRISGAIGGSDLGKAPVQGTVTASPAEVASGGSVTVTARGLPENVPVVIGAGAPQAAYEVIQTAQTGSGGTLQANVRLPDWVSDMNRLVLVVAADDGRWALRTAPVRITSSKP